MCGLSGINRKHIFKCMRPSDFSFMGTFQRHRFNTQSLFASLTKKAKQTPASTVNVPSVLLSTLPCTVITRTRWVVAAAAPLLILQHTDTLQHTLEENKEKS